MIHEFSFKTAKEMARHFYGRKNNSSETDDAFESLANHLKAEHRWDGSLLKKLEQEREVPRTKWTAAKLEFLGRWGALGCPVVRFSKEWGASVCCSSIPSELFQLICPPWDSFIIDVPPELGMKLCFGSPSEQHDLAYIKVGLLRGRVESADGLVDGWYVSQGNEAGLENGEALVIEAGRLFDSVGFSEDVPPASRETLQLIGPLIGAVCMAFANGDRRSVGARSEAEKARRGAKYPTRQEYIVGRPVEIDLSRRVAEYVAKGGTGSKLKVQGVVAGHWKNQPHGRAGSLRKFIHIEPYWRGPEDAPIAVRPHVLIDQPQDQS